MTKLLISVNTVEEAITALNERVDIIDLKDPHVGTLGALNLGTTRQIVKALNGRAMLSATVGDQPSHAALWQAIDARANLGIDIIKIAVEDIDELTRLQAKFNMYQQSQIKLVAVFFAEDFSVEKNDYAALKLLKTLGFYGAMLDTNTKSIDLCQQLTINQMQMFVNHCAKNALFSGLAGSLKPQHIDLLSKVNPKYIGFRGGVCDNNNRLAALNSEKLKNVQMLLRQSHILSNKSLQIAGLALHS